MTDSITHLETLLAQSPEGELLCLRQEHITALLRVAKAARTWSRFKKNGFSLAESNRWEKACSDVMDALAELERTK